MKLLTLVLAAALPCGAAVTEFPSPAGEGAAQPSLSAGKDALVLSWLEHVPNSNRATLRVSRFAGGMWSSPSTVVQRDDLFVNWADFPSVVEDERGTLFAHWLQKSGPSTYAYDVRIATSTDGGKSWSPSFLLNRDGRKNEHGFATLAPLPAGGVGATWLDGRNMPEGKEEGEMTVRYAAVNERGRLTSDVELDRRVCECCTTAMVMSAKGPVIAYRDRELNETRDISIVRRARTGWTKPRTLHADGWKIDGCPVNGPQLDAVGNHVAVAWFTGANERPRAYVAFSKDAGDTFGAPIAIDDGKPAGRVDLVMLDATSAAVVWVEQTPAGAEIRARRVRAKGSVDPSVKIADSSAARAAGFPRMARMGRDLYIAWTEQSATSRRIRIARTRF